MLKREDISWNEEKNWHLKETRGVGFEDVVEAIETGQVLADIEHHDETRRGHQRLLVVDLHGYACVVPYVSDGVRIFLKTIYHSREMQHRYLGKRS